MARGKRRAASDSTAALKKRHATPLPDPPDGYDFDDEERAVWYGWARSRIEWRELDLDVLAAAVTPFVRIRRIDKRLDEEGLVVTDDKGRQKKHPLVSVRASLWNDVQKSFLRLKLFQGASARSKNAHQHPPDKQPSSAKGNKGVSLLA